MDCSINAPQKQGNTRSAWVWFDGTTALKEGQGVCYNWDYGTAAESDARRGNRVEVPTIANAQFFAGVCARDYTAKTTPQLVEIFLPGSVCKILAKKALTIGVGRVTCQAGGALAGYFTAEGFAGQGSAVPLQTLDTSVTAALTLAVLEDGPQSGLQQILTATAGGALQDANAVMVGGVTHFAAATVASDATYAVPDGTSGLKKRFVIDGTQGTNNIVITVNGIRVDGSTALVSDTMDTTGEELTLEWYGDWYARGIVGGTLA